MKKRDERSMSPTMSTKPLSQKKPQIEEEVVLKAHNIIGITLRGGLNLHIGKTLRKTSHVIMVVVQTIMKEIVGRKRGTKRVKLLTTRKMIP